MFTKRKKSVHPGTTDTLIGEGTMFCGKLSSQAGIRIEGQVDGEITSSGEVTIGEQGSVDCEIAAVDLMIAGRLQGKVTASGRVTITSTGQFKGTLQAGTLVIEPGGVFQGTSEMKTRLEPAAEQDEEPARKEEYGPVPATV